MSREQTKNQLEHILNDTEHRVVALTGHWGTGKTHLWTEVASEFQSVNEPRVLYASLFGARTINDVRLKLLENSTREYGTGSDSRHWQTIKEGWNAAKKLLEGFHSSFGAIGDIPLLIAPSVLRNKTIVLDDIERKDSALETNEILGFIDELTQQHGCRFVLILNEVELETDERWLELKEKVIDHELALSTTARDALNIAITYGSTDHVEELSELLSIAGIVNIRVIRKIIKIKNLILRSGQTVPQHVVRNVLPSIVLVTAAYYRGIPNGLTVSYILNTDHANKVALTLDRGAVGDEDESEWDSLLSRVGLFKAGKFELYLAELLETGLYNTNFIQPVISTFIENGEKAKAENQSRFFLEELLWNPSRSEEELKRELVELREKAGLIMPGTINNLYVSVKEYLDSDEAAEALVKSWVEAAERRADLEIDDFTGAPVDCFHPEIQRVMRAKEAERQADVSPLDACKKIAATRSWGSREDLAISNASEKDFERLILGSKAGDFQILLIEMSKFCAQKGQYKAHFGEGLDCFLSACKRIIDADSTSRHARIIRRVLESRGLYPFA